VISNEQICDLKLGACQIEDLTFLFPTNTIRISLISEINGRSSILEFSKLVSFKVNCSSGFEHDFDSLHDFQCELIEGDEVEVHLKASDWRLWLPEGGGSNIDRLFRSKIDSTFSLLVYSENVSFYN